MKEIGEDGSGRNGNEECGDSEEMKLKFFFQEKKKKKEYTITKSIKLLNGTRTLTAHWCPTGALTELSDRPS